MAVFDDHFVCPALHRWLLPEWEGRSVAVWESPSVPVPRPLRRMLAKASIEALPVEPAVASLDVLVVTSNLPDSMPPLTADVWNALRPGGVLADLGVPRRRRAKEVLRPWAYTLRLREAAAMRVRDWIERGAFAPEQWVAVEPVDLVVTLVRRAWSRPR